MNVYGYLVIRDASDTTIWNSGTTSAGSYLVLQNDGNLVMYTSTGSWIWQSNTCCH
jgi:hypothetical protein